ncbi:MAG: hypothetical protein F4Y18_02485 [Cenarchaeum sp. SB0663_bin_5]|jgi:hypothetical protein|nr:hypothetical protein [Cenarchaeum sp. SB0663_bin_5]MYH04021.1 hypothetical protein [Cenarchaeum sp. SB0675_bin_21]MYL11422.1 hypothetical protein [Cenarchaeum sp. SB0669_bin_11]
MTLPLRNIIHDKIVDAGSLTDEDLSKSLSKDGHNVSTDMLNKILLGLEIGGIINVTWFTKDIRKIEVAELEEDETDIEDKKMREREYEASFPGADH